MEITRKSVVTGKESTLDIDITPAQYNAWKKGGLIQNVAPHLSVEDREFLISGITPGEWDSIFPDGEE